MKNWVTIIGGGSIGDRHAASIQSVDPQARIDRLSYRAFRQGDEIASSSTAVVYCGPATGRVEIADRLLRPERPVLFEKPLAASVDDGEQLAAMTLDRGVAHMVGYCLRYDARLVQVRRQVLSGAIGKVHHVSLSVGQLLSTWRPGTDVQSSVSAQKSLGGGALLELSHELDYLLWFFGSPKSLSVRSSTLGNEVLDVEDSVDLICSFDDNLHALVHLDMLDRSTHRQCRIVGSKATCLWDSRAESAVVDTGVEKTLLGHSSESMYDQQMAAFLGGANDPERATVTTSLEVLRLIDRCRMLNSTDETDRAL